MASTELTHDCVYCREPCDGSKRDTYGEHVLGRPLPVCDACDEEFEGELGPWRDW